MILRPSEEDVHQMWCNPVFPGFQTQCLRWDLAGRLLQPCIVFIIQSIKIPVMHGLIMRRTTVDMFLIFDMSVKCSSTPSKLMLGHMFDLIWLRKIFSCCIWCRMKDSADVSSCWVCYFPYSRCQILVNQTRNNQFSGLRQIKSCAYLSVAYSRLTLSGFCTCNAGDYHVY